MTGVSLLVATVAGLVVLVGLRRRLAICFAEWKPGAAMRRASMLGIFLLIMGAGVFQYVGEGVKRGIAVASLLLLGELLHASLRSGSPVAARCAAAGYALAAIGQAIGFVHVLAILSTILFYVAAPIPLVVGTYVLFNQDLEPKCGPPGQPS